MRLLIFTRRHSFPLCHIHKNQVEDDIWIILDSRI
ncbi:hypothetical protein predicted by Glimmer/Critica [Bartonella tribocorum CIP 105476]|uniref:Uncharacterized protein n=1 Tax=Bartonella tribocorum (strain DSM 28219 / CCUG 45778 / CIP 105476 / IBS 506) TaxID=382640 RepID=A9IRE0_BART1|nr:hypothetical protein predicted by Glimmer/Critica [Bartonella tribocorum CIP 105476]